jgi:hypothetical protein
MDPDFPRRTPPPLPTTPPVPVAPLGYAQPIPVVPRTDTIYHQAAKAAWVAPLIMFALSCLITGAMGHNDQDNRPVRLVQGVLSILLIVGGLACGIVAMCGIRRYGKSGILVPAIVGLLINGLLVSLVGLGFVAGFRSAARARTVVVGGGAGSARVAPAPITSPQSALRQTGWMGVAATDTGCTVGGLAMAEPHRDTTALKSIFTTPCSIVVLWFDNRQGSGPVTVDTDGATLRMEDGTTVNALRTRDVLSTAKEDRAQFLAKNSPPYRVSPGVNMEGQFLFVPTGVDLSRATYLYLTVDGKPMAIPGRVFTAQEKTDALNRGAGAASPGAGGP